MKMRVIQGDSFDVLRSMPANSIDALVTDPPYGWRFMGKAWDSPDIKQTNEKDQAYRDKMAKQKGEWRIGSDGRRRRRASGRIAGLAAHGGTYDLTNIGNCAFQVWSESWAKEVYRVLKPGGHALIFCGPRTYHRMATGVEDAGFEIRDQLQWIFGQGFPKSLNVGKGFGTALKPANEPIVMARKPLSEKTVALNVKKWGTGAINIDSSRILYNSKVNFKSIQNGKSNRAQVGNFGINKTKQNIPTYKPSGRFPSNLLLDEHAAKVLDEKSGTTKSPVTYKRNSESVNKNAYGRGVGEPAGKSSFNFGDTGGASRFFYVAKTSKTERNRGLNHTPKKVNDGRKSKIDNAFQRGETLRQNTHPTVKPIRLMEYLIRLITPPKGVVLDPFMGSGSTGVAAKSLGFKFIGIERELEYFQIAKRRIKNA